MSGFGQTRTNIGIVRETKRYAPSECVRATPDDPQGAETSPVEHFECVKLRIDRVGALEVQDRAQRIGSDAVLDVINRACDPHLTGRLRFDPEEQGGHCQRCFERIGER